MNVFILSTEKENPLKCQKKKIIDKMKSILSHIGAWSPKAEQVATARFLSDFGAIDRYMAHFKAEVEERLVNFHKGFCELQTAGHPVRCIAPMAAIYLTINIDLIGKRTIDGNILEKQKDVTEYILNEAKLDAISAPGVCIGVCTEMA